MSIPFACAAVMGFALYRAGYLPNVFSSSLTATAVSQRNASCQALIEKAMQASGSYCDQIGSNRVCYGNISVQADLVPGTAQTFTKRGDIVDVNVLRRLSASPLNPDSDEWGIAVFKIIANLPRSLPGQTVTMVVFGNTTLDNTSGNLESFYFSSELGRIVCEKVPNDGIMVTVPEGEGVRFTVNGAELTLMGDASLKAIKNGEMEVSLYNGSGRIVSDGQEQYFGGGEKVTVPLGGEDGNQSVGPPSMPEPLNQDDLDTACAMTGQYCTGDEITPVPGDQAREQVQSGLGITSTTTPTRPTPTFTRIPTRTLTVTHTRTPSITTTGTILVIPSWTPSRTPSRTRVPTLGYTATRTNRPARTATRTPIRTPTPTRTGTPTQTATLTYTPTATFTPTHTETPTNTTTPTDTLTPTATFTPTDTATPISPPSACAPSDFLLGSLDNPGGGIDLTLDITNNSGGLVTITAMHVVWDDGTAGRLDSIYLGLPVGASTQFANPNAPASPIDIPADSPFTGPIARRQIAAGASATMTLRFEFALSSGSGYSVEITFDPLNCFVQASR